ncbi:hypothetical protein FORC066_1130 [Yersinia enterocolitica]|nr:hypothetical protein FORC066_1130 [Yersinia enterocolitica]
MKRLNKDNIDICRIQIKSGNLLIIFLLYIFKINPYTTTLTPANIK